MSTDTFSTRSTTSRNQPPPFSGERRRQWLRQRGLLSPHNGPTRRLASLLPRKSPQSPTSSRAPSSHQHSSARIHLEVHQNVVPVVVAKPPTVDANDDQQPSATRTVSTPPDDSPRLRTPTFRSRSNHRRWKPRDFETNPSPQSRSRRLLNRLKRKPRPLQPLDTPVRASLDVPRARDREVERVSLHRHSLDRKINFTTTNPAPRPRPRAVYTVFDRELPRHVLQGNSRFEKTSWNDYHEHIDELAEDEQFMEYLTAPVQRRPPLQTDSGGQTKADAHNLAVNKLYPLAFIRLLEAHAKCDTENDEPSNPQEEEHRYDDVDRAEEGRVERTVSNGMYDMGRFRAVRGPRGGSTGSRSGREHLNYRSPRLLEGKSKADASPYHSRLFSRISRDSDVVSVPVC